jgi:hypothetical protein
MADSLFSSNEELNRKSPLKWLIIGFLLVVVAAAGGSYWYFFKPEKKLKAAENIYAENKMRDTVVMFLAQPAFTGKEFQEQILGRAKLELFHLDTKDVYFSLPEMPEAEKDAAIARFIADKNKIENAVLDRTRMRLGKYSLEKSAEKAMFFKTALENVKINPDTVLNFDFKRANYSLHLRELIDLSNNSKIYGGMINADANLKKDGKIVVFANHGAFVAKPEEPSLQRLASELLKDLPADVPNLREQKIQRLLDFVSGEISYSDTEALSSYETLKRPNETLMTRTADCSNKTILLASLLEQIGEPYLMLYAPGHITIAVEQGAFPLENGLSFTWDNKKYLIAESTLAGFEIGKTLVQGKEKLRTIQFVQIPRYKDIIFDSSSMKPVDFR